MHGSEATDPISGFLLYVAGTNAVVRYIPAMANADDLDAPILYQDICQIFCQEQCQTE